MAIHINILMHHTSRTLPLSRYAIVNIAKYWQQDGNKVSIVFGDQKYVPADIAILHVDLSVVPDSYLQLASEYPVALNKQVKDIRKSTISTNLLKRNDGYAGKVIIKSDLNYAGMPERFAAGTLNKQKPSNINSPKDYMIFDSLADVPDQYFEYDDIIVERFTPETDNNEYFIRYFVFLGNQTTFYRVNSLEPIINSNNWKSMQVIEPTPEVYRWREQFNFDYGKFDYVIHDGIPVLLDANKTVGALPGSPILEENWRQRAKGIYSYLA